MNKNIFLTAILLLTSCGAEYRLKQAEKLEKEESYIEAAKLYNDIALSYETHTAEAYFKEAEIYRMYLQLYPEAVQKYRIIYELYPGQTEWVEKAEAAIIGCPDYFPLQNGNKWTEVDSQTGGRNMREVRICTVESGTDTAKSKIYVDKRMYAGENFIKDISGRNYYKKQDLEIREFIKGNQGGYLTILKFPFEEGNIWESSDGRNKIYYKIEGTGVECKVKAGTFENCIKVSQKFGEIKAMKYNYYAPRVGKVLTTIKSPGAVKETRNTELGSFLIND